MRVYLATWIGIASIIVAFIALFQSALAFQTVLGITASYVVLVLFFVLRCPKCGSLTWTWRFEPGRRGLLNQFTLPVPPIRCSMCRISFLQVNLGDRRCRDVGRRRFWID